MDDGRYPNLAQVPERPTDIPSFAEARAVEKSLIANRTAASEPGSADTAASEGAAGTPAAVKTASAAAKVAARAEDRAPCLGAETGQPTTTVRFDKGSSALTADERRVLADTVPEVRSGKGTIRIVGHGDTDEGSGQGAVRFDLAVARAGAVAHALAGFGIPAQRMAVAVACTDAAASGASVQLYL